MDRKATYKRKVKGKTQEVKNPWFGKRKSAMQKTRTTQKRVAVGTGIGATLATTLATRGKVRSPVVAAAGAPAVGLATGLDTYSNLQNPGVEAKIKSRHYNKTKSQRKRKMLS